MRLILLCCGLALTACTNPIGNAPPDAAPVSGPPVRVDLPPLIKLEGSLPPETHPDSTLRIDGLLARRQKHLGQKIVVRGYLVQRYDCPEEAKRCERPHVWLADSPAGGDKRLMLVGVTKEIVDALTDGEQYVVTGRFERKSGDGFVMSSGLLIYESIQGLEVPEEDGKKPRRPRFR